MGHHKILSQLMNEKFFLRFFVLLSIRTGVLRLKKQLKRLLEMMMMMTGSPPASKCGTPVRDHRNSSLSVTDWIKSGPSRMARSPSSYLPHNRNLLELVEETSLLNNMTWSETPCKYFKQWYMRMVFVKKESSKLEVLEFWKTADIKFGLLYL